MTWERMTADGDATSRAAGYQAGDGPPDGILSGDLAATFPEGEDGGRATHPRQSPEPEEVRGEEAHGPEDHVVQGWVGVCRYLSPEGGEGGLGENGEVDALVGVQPPHHGAGYTDEECQDHQHQGRDATVALYGGYRRPARIRSWPGLPEINGYRGFDRILVGGRCGRPSLIGRGLVRNRGVQDALHVVQAAGLDQELVAEQ